MAQRLKEEVRERILAAARDSFIAHGYGGTRLQDVAAAAGVATGNLYRYFADKDALFDALAPRATAARLLRLLRARVRELGAAADWPAMTAGGSARAGALLDFLVRERTATLIMLAGAAGSPLAHLRPLVIAEFTRLAARHLAQRDGAGTGAPPPVVLVQIFTATVDMIVAILREREGYIPIAQAFAAFWRYQLAGLQALLGATGRREAAVAEFDRRWSQGGRAADPGRMRALLALIDGADRHARECDTPS